MAAGAHATSGIAAPAAGAAVVPARRVASAACESPRSKQRSVTSPPSEAGSNPAGGGHSLRRRPSPMRAGTTDGSGASRRGGGRNGGNGGDGGSSSSGTRGTRGSCSSGGTDTSRPKPSARLSPARRSARRVSLEDVKEVVKGAVSEIRNYVKDLGAAMEGRPPSSADIVAAMTPAVMSAAVAAVWAPAAVKNANAGGVASATDTHAAVAASFVPSLMRGAFQVSICRRVKKTLFAGSKDNWTDIMPPASGTSNRWAPEHADEMVWGTVNRTYKAHPALQHVPDIFEGKVNFQKANQDDMDKAMTAIVRTFLADGRSAMRA